MAIPKLTTDKFRFEYNFSNAGLCTKVVRETDKAEKVFFMAGMKHGALPGIKGFMNSLTDDLAEGYFPKQRKEKEQKNG